MANIRYSQLPVATSLDGTEIVPIDQSDGAGGYVTRRTTTSVIATTGVASGVTPGTYGDSTHVAQFTVDTTGRVTYATNIALSLGAVTSVGLSAPADLSVTGSPITTSGTLGLDWTTPPTGTGAMVRATSPTLVTPAVGVATATSINKVAITTPATGSTLTIQDGFTLTVNGNATVSGTNTGDQTITLTGDVTGSGTGSFAATIANNAVTLAKMATVATATFLGRTTAGTGNVEALTATQATALLNNVVGDSGSGGTKGLVPAPAAGDAAASKFLKADGTWTTPGGSGTVTSVSVVSANGFAGSVATATTTPAITLTTTITGILSGNGTAISATSTTGSGSVVLATSPTLVTPTLGVATATSVNKVAITAPATSATLTIPDGVTFTGPAASGTAMTLDNTETVTGVKTFGSAGAVGRFKLAGTTSGSTILDASAVASGTLTFPAATDTLVGKATTDTLTNKTISGASNTITNVSLTAGVTGTLPVANGGTGAATLTANNVLLGNGTSALQAVAPGTSGNVLTSNGTTWTSTAPVTGSMTLLGTLTTTSGTTQSLTGIGGYNRFYVEILGVSFTSSVAMTLALSSTNGAAYGTAQTITVTNSAGTLAGAIDINGVSSTSQKQSATSVTQTNSTGGTATLIGVQIATNTAAACDAIRFAGGNFNAGTIRIYGVK